MSNFSFGIKLKFTGEVKMSNGRTVYLKNTKDGHNKYYHLILRHKIGDEYPYQIQIEYGKFGTSGNVKYHKFKEERRCTDYFQDLITKKTSTNKGYEHYNPNAKK